MRLTTRTAALSGAVLALALTAPVGAAPLAHRPGQRGTAPASRPPASGGGAAAGISWGRCPADADVWHDTFCGTVRVPLDYAEPAGRQLTLTVSRVAAAGTPAQRKGVLLVNPGGPGESGLGLAHDVWAALPRDLSESYDVIGFDPRGVGHSTPVNCGNLQKLFPRPLPDYVPATPAEEKPHLDRARAIARQCAARAGDVLPHLNTTNAARDLDRIREALGEPQVDYLGYSYGTTLGATYASIFPNRVRRMILDSVADPVATNYEAGLDQSRALQRRVEQFYDWTARYDRTYHLGSTRALVAGRWQALRTRLKTRPAGRVVGPSELDDLTAGAMYTDAQWESLAAALAGAARGDDTSLVAAGKDLSLTAPTDAAFLAYTCGDTPWPRDWARWEADARSHYPGAPVNTWLNTWYSAPCAYWPVPGRVGTPIRGNGLAPVLLLQSAADPATPLGGARKMARALPGSRLVVQGGGNHGVYLFDQNGCMDAIGSAYLRTGAVPAAATTCPATPAPAAAAAAGGRQPGRGALSP